MKLRKILLMATPLSIFTTVAAVSCGQQQFTQGKVDQDKILNMASAKQVLESAWLNNTLAALYNASTDPNDANSLTKNTQYNADLYNAYVSLVEYNLATNPFYMANQLTTWNQSGLIPQNDSAALSSLGNYNAVPTRDQFNILTGISETNVVYDAQQLLLVYKYFSMDNPTWLAKVNSDFETNKNTYQNNQYNLISYALSKKEIQQWNYKEDANTHVLTTITRSISSVSDYNMLVLNSSAALKVPQPNLLFNSANNSFERQMGGFLNIVALPSSITFSFDAKDLLKLDANSLSGFYNYENNQIVTIQENGNLNATINYNNTNGVSYVNIIAPVKKSITTKGADGKDTTSDILSFDTTPYASNLFNLEMDLALNDKSLYTTAQNAFVKLGFVLKVDNSTLSDSLKGESFITN